MTDTQPQETPEKSKKAPIVFKPEEVIVMENGQIIDDGMVPEGNAEMVMDQQIPGPEVMAPDAD